MEKIVDAAKSVSQVLIAASAALLLFAFVPERTKIYADAAAEMVAVRSADQKAYFTFVASAAENLAADARSSFSVLEPYGVPLAVVKVIIHCSFPPRRARVNDWVEFANDDRLAIRSYTLSKDSVRESVIPALKLERDKYGLQIDSVFLSPHEDLLSLSADEEQLLGDALHGRAQRLCWPIPSADAKFMLNVVGHYGATRPTLSVPVKVDMQEQQGPLFRTWAINQGWKYEGSSDGTPFLLSATSRLAEFSDKSLAQAHFLATDKEVSSAERLSLFGFSIPSEAVAWATVALLWLSLSLHVHVRRINSSSLTDGFESQWLPLVPGPISLPMFAISLVLLPAAAEVLVLRRVSGSGLALTAHIAASVTMLGINLWTLFLLRAVGRRWCSTSRARASSSV
jgi:hypothetical protein